MTIKKDAMSLVKKNIQGIIGSKVKFESDRGRNKTTVEEGVIESVYPSIFTIQMYEGKLPSRKISFSYTDVLTRSVQITLCK